MKICTRGWVNGRAASSHSRKNASPIRISPSPRGFDQHGMSDRPRHQQSLFPAARLLDEQTDHMLHPFAVTDDLLGERLAHRGQSRGKLLSCASIFSHRAPLAPLASSNTVSLVEVSPSMDMQFKDWSHASRRRGCSSRGLAPTSVNKIHQHGRKLRMDHAGALRDSQHGDFFRDLTSFPTTKRGNARKLSSPACRWS